MPITSWRCIDRCGACCHLQPEERPELPQYLRPEDLAHYMSLVGPDGWCVNYDQDDHRCRIYETRPWFCRVQADTFGKMFGVRPDELDSFAIACCQQQIEAVYGECSDELKRFNDATNSTEISDV